MLGDGDRVAGVRFGPAARIPKTELSVEIQSHPCKPFVGLLLFTDLSGFVPSNIPKMVSASLVLFM